MKFTIVALPLLASLTSAQPHKHGHQHVAKHREARNEPPIEWVTEYDYTTEVIPVTTTIWVPEGYVAPAEPTSISDPTKATVPAQFFQPASQEPASPSSPSSASTSSTSIYVAPPPPTSAPAPTTLVPQPAKPIETEPAAAPPTTTPSPQPTPEYVAPVQAAPSPSPAPAPAVVDSPAPASGSTSGSSGGECSKGSPCEGDITHYDANAGIGACGWMSDGNTEDVVALSHVLMGTQSNGNPFCGQSVTIKLNGKSVIAKVVDKCMGCAVHAIDLSDHAFSALEDMGVGRTQVEWFFN